MKKGRMWSIMLR